MEFIKIKTGQFHMGKNESDSYAKNLETSHFVRISYPFYMLKTPVTVEQYRRFVKEEKINTSYLIHKWDGNDWVIGPYFDEINTDPDCRWNLILRCNELYCLGKQVLLC